MARPQLANRIPPLLAVLLFAGTSILQASNSDSVTESEVEKHEGAIKAIKYLKGNRKEITVIIGGKEKSFTIDNLTLVYQLTARNREIFAEKDKLDQMVKDANQYRKSVQEFKEGELDLVLAALGQQSTREVVTGQAEEKTERGGQKRTVIKDRNALGVLTQVQLAFTKDEEQRRKDYGPAARLRANQKAIVVAKRASDETFMVLVVGPDGAKKDDVPRTPSIAEEAGRKLKNAKQLLKEADEIKGAERDRVLTKALDRLREIVDKYPDSKEAEEANKLLADN